MTRPDLDAIRARCEAAQVIFERSSVVAPCVYDDIPALLAYIDELQEERNDWREAQEATQVKSDFWRSQFRATYTTGETELAHRIATLEHMLAEERENVDTLRAAVEHAEQRFVDEYDAHKEAKRDRDELREELFDWQHTVECVLGDNWTSADGHDAKAARKVLAEWAEKAQGEAPRLRVEVEELKARITTLEAMKP